MIRIIFWITVSTVTWPWTGLSVYVGSIPGRDRGFSLLHCFHNGSEAHLHSSPVDTRGFFLGVTKKRNHPNRLFQSYSGIRNV